VPNKTCSRHRRFDKLSAAPGGEDNADSGVLSGIRSNLWIVFDLSLGQGQIN